MANEVPKNAFREEVGKQAVSEKMLLMRDQRVMYLRFKCEAELLEGDRIHTQAAIDKVKAFGNMIFRLSNSEARTGLLEQNKQHIEKLEKQLEAQGQNRAQQVILSLLEEKFGEEREPEAIIETPELKDD